MQDEYAFTTDPVTIDNLAELSRLQSVLDERRICELHEAATSLTYGILEYYESGMNVYELLSLLSGGIDLASGDVHRDAMKENISRLHGYLNAASSLDRTVFCELLLRALRERSIVIGEVDFLPSSSAPETFVYVRNAYADEAYDVFSQDFRDPRVSYARDFKEAVGRVVDGSVTYVLLPLEERGGNRIQTVAQLIFANELKINSVTPVFGFDGNADMKYAIASRHFTVPRRRQSDDRYLEIRLAQDASLTLASLLSVSEYFGHSLYRVSSVGFDTEDGTRQFFSVVLRDDGRDFTDLLVYLTLFTDSYTPVGIYKNLE